MDLVGYRTQHYSSVFFSAKCQMSASYKGNKKLNINESSGSQKLASSETPRQLVGVQSAGPASVSSSVGLGWGPRIFISKSSSSTDGPHFEAYWVKGDNYCGSKEKTTYMACDEFDLV